MFILTPRYNDNTMIMYDRTIQMYVSFIYFPHITKHLGLWDFTVPAVDLDDRNVLCCSRDIPKSQT